MNATNLLQAARDAEAKALQVREDNDAKGLPPTVVAYVTWASAVVALVKPYVKSTKNEKGETIAVTLVNEAKRNDDTPKGVMSYLDTISGRGASRRSHFSRASALLQYERDAADRQTFIDLHAGRVDYLRTVNEYAIWLKARANGDVAKRDVKSKGILKGALLERQTSVATQRTTDDVVKNAVKSLSTERDADALAKLAKRADLSAFDDEALANVVVAALAKLALAALKADAEKGADADAPTEKGAKVNA